MADVEGTLKEDVDIVVLTYPIARLSKDVTFHVPATALASCTGDNTGNDDLDAKLLDARLWQLCVLPIIYGTLGRYVAWTEYASVWSSALGYQRRPFGAEQEHDTGSPFDDYCKVPATIQQFPRVWTRKEIQTNDVRDKRQLEDKAVRVFAKRVGDLMTKRSRACRVFFI